MPKSLFPARVARVARQRLSKVIARATVVSKRQRAVFLKQVQAATAGAIQSPRTSQLVDRTRAAKSASFLEQYRRLGLRDSRKA